MTGVAVRQRRRVVCVDAGFGARLPAGALFAANEGLRALACFAYDVRSFAQLFSEGGAFRWPLR